jgi:hypothetical protein
MKIFTTTGNEVPDDFPIQCYEKIDVNMVSQKESHYELWREFAGAWNSIGYKFIICSEQDQIFTESINRFGSSPVPEERMVQEKSLFFFFVSAQSIFESLGYAIYLTASMKNSNDFPFKREIITRLSPEITRDKLKKFYPSESLSSDFTKILASTEYSKINEIRNVLIHRTRPGRNHFMGSEDDRTRIIWLDTEMIIDNQVTASSRLWLSISCEQILKSMNQFVVTLFPSP